MLLIVELVGMTGLASEAGHKIGGPKKHAQVLPHMDNSACNSTELRASDADSPGEQSAHNALQTALTELRVTSAPPWASLPHGDDSYYKGNSA